MGMLWGGGCLYGFLSLRVISVCARCVRWWRVQEGWGVGVFRDSILNLILSNGKYGELMFGAAGWGIVGGVSRLRMVDSVSNVCMTSGIVGAGDMVSVVCRVFCV